MLKMLCIAVAALPEEVNIVVESSESEEGSDVETTSPARKDISSKFIKKDEVCTLFSCYVTCSKTAVVHFNTVVW